MGRRRRGRKSRSRAAAVTSSRSRAKARVGSTKKAQAQVNKASGQGDGMGVGANRKNPYAGLTSGGVPGQHTPSVQKKASLGGLMPNTAGKTKLGRGSLSASKTPTTGGKGARQMSERFSKPQAGRGRGKGSRPIQESQQQMDGGGFRNRGYGMGREQRGYGMGKQQPNFGGDKGYGMGRDQRGSGMGSQEMMQNRGYNSGMASSSRPSKGGSQPIRQPEGRPMNPAANERNPTFAPKPSRSMSRGSSSFNPASGRMEYASQPNNFSRSSQRPGRMSGGFRKNMGTTQGAFKLPNKSTIQK